jgi:antitoxin (DNA-binding transcriptional repressor) of toxin-antitoxin stability system
MDKLAMTGRNKSSRPKPARSKPSEASRSRSSTGSTVVAFPAGSGVPDEMSSSEAKDRISDLVKKAAAGGRTTVISRGYAIAIIGPLADMPISAEAEAPRLPTTEIKSGQTSLKGIIARNDFAVLTIHGEARAAVYRPKARRHPAQTEDKLDRLIDLLEATKAVEQRNERALETRARLQRLIASAHAEIESALALLEKIEPARAATLRAEHAALRARGAAGGDIERSEPAK